MDKIHLYKDHYSLLWGTYFLLKHKYRPKMIDLGAIIRSEIIRPKEFIVYTLIEILLLHRNIALRSINLTLLLIIRSGVVFWHGTLFVKQISDVSIGVPTLGRFRLSLRLLSQCSGYRLKVVSGSNRDWTSLAWSAYRFDISANENTPLQYLNYNFCLDFIVTTMHRILYIQTMHCKSWAWILKFFVIENWLHKTVETLGSIICFMPIIYQSERLR